MKLNVKKKSFGCRNRKVNASRKHPFGKTEFKTESYGCITIFKRKRLHIWSLWNNILRHFSVKALILPLSWYGLDFLSSSYQDKRKIDLRLQQMQIRIQKKYLSDQNLFWVIGLSRILESHWSRQSWACLTKLKQKHSMNSPHDKI